MNPIIQAVALAAFAAQVSAGTCATQSMEKKLAGAAALPKPDAQAFVVLQNGAAVGPSPDVRQALTQAPGRSVSRRHSSDRSLAGSRGRLSSPARKAEMMSAMSSFSGSGQRT